ncbi:MAG: stage II sporulation protein M [Euryarchaeota archaeon]|nr:stage II sporulation protein M [Euryarchaeota archaeon]
MARDKYESYIGGLYRRNERFLIISTVIFFASMFIGYALSGMLAWIMGGVLDNMKRQVGQGELKLTTLSIFLNNFKVILYLYGGGLVLGIITTYLLFYNGVFIGYAASQYPLSNFIVYTIPHGIFEIVGIIVSGAAGFKLAGVVVDIIKGLRHIQPEMSRSNQFNYLLKVYYDDFKESLVLLSIAVILLLIGAFIEANFTLTWANYVTGVTTQSVSENPLNSLFRVS